MPKKPLTVDDLRTAKNLTGFKCVCKIKSLDRPNQPKPYQARVGTKPHFPGEKTNQWVGPRRSTAEEAAQDVCDYINGKKVVTLAPSLKSADHKRVPVDKAPHAPSEAERIAREVIRKARAERENTEGYIYCIAEQTKYRTANDVALQPWAVKIGFALDPNLRIKGLQTGNPRPLAIIGVIKGTPQDEAALHQRFIEQNVLGEWFRPTRELLSIFTESD